MTASKCVLTESLQELITELTSVLTESLKGKDNSTYMYVDRIPPREG